MLWFGKTPSGRFAKRVSFSFRDLSLVLECHVSTVKLEKPAKKLRLMLSFAVGSLLGDVFLHLLPEVWAHMDRENHGNHTRIGLWVITGLLAFMIVEKLMGDETQYEKTSDSLCDGASDLSDSNTILSSSSLSGSSPDSQMFKKHIANSKRVNHQGNKSPNGESHIYQRKVEASAKLKPKNREGPGKTSTGSSKIKVSGYLNLLANVVDNFTHGLAVAASFCISTKVGLATTVAILLHEVPHEVGDFAILLRSGFDRWKAAKAQFLTASGGVVGAVTALTAESAQVAGERTAWILPFTSGGFMYIALVTVVPDLLEEKHGWESLKQVVCICFGVLSMVCVTILFET
ncbi:Zinc transporter zip13-like [Plakobranchus ocellatus]|uniref:Zinc transporter zip13-like n=1 Tax=Plakobranchus ocellatus TaxID=259542 RepID=A0AAV4AMD1_9GAST|nr:Zinc transporter zip13-like [Plakobranchus ocellatus]